MKIVNPLPNANVNSTSTSTSTSQRERRRSSESSIISNQSQSQQGDENGNEVNDHDRITRVATGVLCVIQVTVDCFLKNMIPVVYLDACFCSNRGKLICAMWMDANHHIQPMACYVCGEETINDYLILLTHLMEKGLKNREDLIFSSDGSVAIKSAIAAISRKYDKQYRHVVCTQHIMRNLAAEMARKGMSPRDPENQEVYKQVNNYFWRARNSGTKEIASRYLNEINEICPVAYDYITKWGDDIYLWNHPFPHYQQDTNNPCESLMSLLRRNLKFGKCPRASNTYKTVVRFIEVSLNCMTNRRYFLDSQVVKPGELTMYSFEEWGHWIVERITHEGKNFEMKKGIYQFRGFVLEGEGEGEGEVE